MQLERLLPAMVVLLLFSPMQDAAAAARILGFAAEAGDEQRVVILFDRVPKYKLLELDAPPRLVIDFDDAVPAASNLGANVRNAFVKKVRHAPRDGGAYRIVLDLLVPVAGAYMITARDAPRPALVVAFASSAAGRPARALRRLEIKPLREAVVVIDPGHGGKDPGAVGVRNTHEKDVVLAVSKMLRDLLNREYGMRAVLTRDDDRFVGLRQRVATAHRHHADIFFSIHADAAPTRAARGASVYMLSEKGASTEAARLLARRENAAALVGDADLQERDQDLASTLIDLSQKAAMEYSERLARAVLNAFGRAVKKQRLEAAAFLVLKSPGIPSVLIELGYLSNPGEEAKLRTAAYQHRLATQMLAGIKRYFSVNATPELLLARTTVHDYVVKRGDTLSGIAMKFGTGIADIRQMSKLPSDLIRIGQKLKIPVRKQQKTGSK